MVMAKGATLERFVDSEAQSLSARSKNDAVCFECLENLEVHQFVVEGDDVDALGQAVKSASVGRRAQHDVVNGLCRGVVAGESEHRKLETEVARAFTHHVGELSGSHHSNAGEAV